MDIEYLNTLFIILLIISLQHIRIYRMCSTVKLSRYSQPLLQSQFSLGVGPIFILLLGLDLTISISG